MTVDYITIYIDGMYIEPWQMPYFVNKFYKDTFYYNIIEDINGNPFISKEEVLDSDNVGGFYDYIRRDGIIQPIPYNIHTLVED